MKKAFFICTICKDGKYFSWVESISQDTNIAAFCRHNNIETLEFVESSKQAERRAEQHNKDFQQNGTYMF